MKRIQDIQRIVKSDDNIDDDDNGDDGLSLSKFVHPGFDDQEYNESEISFPKVNDKKVGLLFIGCTNEKYAKMAISTLKEYLGLFHVFPYTMNCLYSCPEQFQNGLIFAARNSNQSNLIIVYDNQHVVKVHPYKDGRGGGITHYGQFNEDNLVNAWMLVQGIFMSYPPPRRVCKKVYTFDVSRYEKKYLERPDSFTKALNHYLKPLAIKIHNDLVISK